MTKKKEKKEKKKKYFQNARSLANPDPEKTSILNDLPHTALKFTLFDPLDPNINSVYP